jgi:predicted nucleic acid-binding protein
MNRRRSARAKLPTIVLVDSSAFFALANYSDAHHRDAADILDHLTRAGAKLVTTNFVLAEAHALIVARTRRADMALEFLTNAYTSELIDLIRVTETDEQRALAILTRYLDKLFSFTDAICFAVMERNGITHAFSFDNDFTQYGFTILTAEFFR